MPPAARISDMHTCPLVNPGPVPHVGGPIITGEATVLIGFMPAARISDTAICTGPPDTIAMGSPTVLIGGMPASRIGDATFHGGVIVMGCATVIIGEVGMGSPLSPTATIPAGENPRMSAIRTILQGSATGQQALALFDANGVNVRFAAGGGSYFDSSTNTMTIDTNNGIVRQSLTFTHEMGHAEYHHTGNTADINALNRTDYVDGMVAEESDGTVRSIEARDELQAAGYDVSGANYPLQNQYHQAYNQGAANEQAANPGATDAQLDAAGQAAGRARVEQGFQNGEVVTSNTDPGQSYPDYYGDAWDNAHPGP